MPKGMSSIPLATDKNAFASAEDWSLKNPTTATLLALINSCASSTLFSSLAGGPVFFSSHATISSACLPPM